MANRKKYHSDCTKCAFEPDWGPKHEMTGVDGHWQNGFCRFDISSVKVPMSCKINENPIVLNSTRWCQKTNMEKACPMFKEKSDE